jgi:hypothetical protein
MVAHTHECVGFGSRGAPPPWIYQHGTLLRLSRPRVVVGAGLNFSLYENVTGRALPRTAVPADTAWRYCDPGAELRLGFAPRERARVVVARALRTPASAIFAAPVHADGTTGAAVPMVGVGRLYRVELRGERAPMVGARITARPSGPISNLAECSGVRAYILPGEPGS